MLPTAPLCSAQHPSKGEVQGLGVLFPRQAGAKPLATENTQPEGTGMQLLPSSSQEHVVQKSQSHDLEHISTKKLRGDRLFLHWAWGTWNYIPNCFLPFPCPRANWNPSNPIVPYSLSPSFWFFMQSLLFIPPCVRTGCCLVSPLYWVPTILLLLKGNMPIPLGGGRGGGIIMKKQHLRKWWHTLSLFNPASSNEREHSQFHVGKIIITLVVIPWKFFVL